MTTRTHGADQIHPVRGGYYYKTDIDMVYWHPTKGGKRLVLLHATKQEWTEILGEK